MTIQIGRLLQLEALTEKLFKYGYWSRPLVLLGVLFNLGCENIAIPTIQKPTLESEHEKKPFFQLSQIKYSDIPGWKLDSHNDLLPVFLKSCVQFKKYPLDRKVGKLEEMGKVKDWVSVCDIAATVNPSNAIQAQYFFETQFQPYAYGNRQLTSGIFTGYYEPELRGSFQPSKTYRFPLLSKPKDIVFSDLGKFDNELAGKKLVGRLEGNRFMPYLNRAQIEEGGLAGRQLEILWVDDRVDAFFLHIQGSGKIILPDGTFVRVGFAGRNGHRYTSVGRELVAMGEMLLDEVTMPSIRNWMEEHPVAATSLMRKNKSYIFFRILKSKGPIGSHGVVLTPGRSIALDPKFTPYGVPVWLSTSYPGGEKGQLLQRLFVAQDTGAAIKGIVRGDVFWGHGVEAGRKAGLMKDKGTLFVLLPRSAAIKEPTK